jgi:PilZ domain
MSNSKASLDARERRQAQRYPVRTLATLEFAEENWEVHLLDISATGVRFAILDEHELKPGDLINLVVQPEENPTATSTSNSPIQLHGKVVHAREHIIGLSLLIENENESKKLAELIAYFADMNI